MWANRSAVNEDRADYFPIFLYKIANLFWESTECSRHCISRPDEHGFISPVGETIATKAEAETARCAIAQVNKKMPGASRDYGILYSLILMAKATEKEQSPNFREELERFAKDRNNVYYDGFKSIEKSFFAISRKKWNFFLIFKKNTYSEHVC